MQDRYQPKDPGYRFAHPGFCNGPWLVNPFFCVDPLAGHLLLYGIGAVTVTLWGALRSRPANLRGAWLWPLPGWRPDRIHRPGEGTSLGESLVSWPAQNR